MLSNRPLLSSGLGNEAVPQNNDARRKPFCVVWNRQVVLLRLQGAKFREFTKGNKGICLQPGEKNKVKINDDLGETVKDI